jgi:DNA-binding NarL/FixJ family response regulator
MQCREDWLVNAASTIAPLPTREPLTRRELEVLQLIADGLANKEIGIRLCVSTETVKSHVCALFSKLGANSRARRRDCAQTGTARVGAVGAFMRLSMRFTRTRHG